MGRLISSSLIFIGYIAPVLGSELATFTLYDNGASKGGTEITMSLSDFAALEADGDNDVRAPPGERFAVSMSSRIEVSKFNAPKPVIATRAFREDGELIVTFAQLQPASTGEQRRVYLVPQDLQFVWPFVEYGHKQAISPNILPATDGGPLILESMSETPRVFRIYNMATKEEAASIIETALNASGKNTLARSTVGSGQDADGNDLAREDSGRTSKNNWDHESPTAVKLLTRCFKLVRIEEDEGKRDGLQIVYYEPGQGYNTHPDYFGAKEDQDFNFLPYDGGSNRFATLFMYLNEPEAGGSTLFPAAPRVGPPIEMPKEGETMFENGTWEVTVNKQCYSELVVPPKLGTAALFYSVLPDGRLDPDSKHAACPVIKGTKWGANVWIWNKQRFGEIRTGDKRSVRMINECNERVYISWEGRSSGSIEPGETMNMNSFEFHRFKASFASHKDKKFAEFTVQQQPLEQTWVINQPRVYGTQAEGDGRAEDARRTVIVKSTLQEKLFISFKGKPMGIVEAGSTLKLFTFIGHGFEASLESHTGKVISTYVVTSESQEWLISRLNFEVDDDDEL